MKRNSFTSSFRRLPRACIAGFLAFVLICIITSAAMKTATFWRFCYLYGSPGYSLTVQGEIHQISEAKEGKTRVFLIGASQGVNAFDDKYLNSAFKDRYVEFFNLSREGAMPATWFMLEDKMLKKNPDIVIMLIGKREFYSESEVGSQLQRYFDPKILSSIYEYFGISNFVDEREWYMNLVTGEALPAYKYNHDLRNAVFYWLKEMSERTQPRKHVFKKDRPQEYFERCLTEYGDQYYRDRYYTKWEEYIFSQMAENMAQNGVKLFVVNAPTHPLHKHLYRPSLETKYNDFLTHQSEELGFIYLPQSQLPTFNEEHFVDFLHLNESGRKLFSAFLETYVSEIVSHEM